jgi:hypothetical protein
MLLPGDSWDSGCHTQRVNHLDHTNYAGTVAMNAIFCSVSISGHALLASTTCYYILACSITSTSFPEAVWNFRCVVTLERNKNM